MNIYFLNKYNGKIRFVLNKIAEDFILWLTGGLFYFYLEIAFRNYSHYSMIICGGICFLIVGKIGEYILKRENNILKAEALIMFFGALAITSMELFTGIIVNLIFNMNVYKI